VARVHARYTTPAGRTVTIVDNLPILRTGYQCDGCFHKQTDLCDIADMNDFGRMHASTCKSNRPYKPTYWDLI
jgi:hypothetical protein